MRPTPVDSFPADESPYGVRGLIGNCRDQVLNDLGEAHPGWRVCRGGLWTNAGVDLRPTDRLGAPSSHVSYGSGGRLAFMVRSWSPEPKHP